MLAIALALVTASPAPHVMDVRLVAESTAPRPGATVLVGFVMEPKPGWHGYWSNPGGSGLAPSVEWSAPPGVRFGPLLHPAPTLMRSMGLVSFVHAGTHVLLSRMSVARSVAPGTALAVAAELSWAACSDKLCVPQHATLPMTMTAGDGAPSADAPLLHQALHKLPAAIGSGTYAIDGKTLTLQLPAKAALDPASTHFYPDENGYFDPEAARTSAAPPLRMESPLLGQAPKAITGVVSDGSSAYRVTFVRGSIAAPPEAAPATPDIPRPASQTQQPQPTRVITPAQPASTPAKSRHSWLGIALAALALAVAGLAAALRKRRP